VELRKITEHDAPYLVNWRNSNAEFFPPGPPLTLESHRSWYQGYLRDPQDHMYMVCAPGLVGTVAIHLGDREIGRVMRGPVHGEKGAMSKALLELMRIYGFGSYILRVLEGNEHAIEFYRRLGFSTEGRIVHYSVPCLIMHKSMKRSPHERH
jgi:RimJ/RimL family protein N-acetyltransferase